jgi:hypothetical protein
MKGTVRPGKNRLKVFHQVDLYNYNDRVTYCSFQKKFLALLTGLCKSEKTQTSHKSKQLKLDIHEDFLPADFEFAGLEPSLPIGRLRVQWIRMQATLLRESTERNPPSTSLREVLGGFLKLPWQTKI